MGARLLRGWLGAPAARDRRHSGPSGRDRGAARRVAAARRAAKSRSRTSATWSGWPPVPGSGPSARASSGPCAPASQAIPSIAQLLAELGTRRTDQRLPRDPRPRRRSARRRVHAARDHPGRRPARDRARGWDDPVERRRGPGRAARSRRRRARASSPRSRPASARRPGITSLKVKHNGVFGYFLEVPRAHIKKVPNGWVRKQTLVNAERYVTEELAGARGQGARRPDHRARPRAASCSRPCGRPSARRANGWSARRGARGPRCARGSRRGRARPTTTSAPSWCHGPSWTSARADTRSSSACSAPVASSPTTPRSRLGPDGSAETARLWVITGPNMGGKSTSCARSR